jgi:hypothetical protein
MPYHTILGVAARAIVKPILIVIAILTYSVILQSTLISGVSANIPVELEVPKTAIRIQGRASPSSQVIIYQESLAVASTTANSAGIFSVLLDGQSPGIYAIGVESIDIAGSRTPRITKSIAVNYQQTSQLSFFLPPTITASPQSQVFGGTNTITFRGYAVPGATVTIYTNNGNLNEFTASANQNGLYSRSITTSSFGVGVFQFYAQSKLGSQTSDLSTFRQTFIITPPAPATVLPPSTVSLAPVPNLQPSSAPSIDITFPEGNEYFSNGSLLIRGQTSPFASIILYENDKIIGTVFADSQGNWIFYFTSTKPLHRLSVVSCANSLCSEKQTLPIIISPEQDTQCSLNIELQSYQLNANVNEAIDLSSKDKIEESDVVAYIEWGDQTHQQFNLQRNEIFSQEYTYTAPGQYNGFILLGDNTGCSSQPIYFTATISEKPSGLYNWWVALLLVATVLLAFGAKRSFDDKYNK